MSKNGGDKGKSFWDNPFGGLLDFNRDGKESFLEKWFGLRLFEELSKEYNGSSYSSSSSDLLYSSLYSWRENCEDGSEFGVDPEDYETEEEYSEALEEARYAWRYTCEDGSEFGVDPEDYETEEEYNKALEEAKTAWREDCEDGSEFGVDPEDYETEEEYNEALEGARYAWRDTCEDGSEFDVAPEDYESEDEYNEALEEARYAWRDTCEDGSEFDVDPEDYESEDEYNCALAEAQGNARGIGASFLLHVERSDDEDRAGELKMSDFPNKRSYNAAYALANDYFSYANDEREKRQGDCCRFIIEKADTITAAGYLDYEEGFLYAQAVKDNFTLPVSLPDEDDSREYELSQVICKIAKRDIPLSFRVWEWCLESFLPYARYDEYAASDLTNAVIDDLCNFPDGYITELARYMDRNKDFMETVMQASGEPAYDLSELIAAAIGDNLLQTARALFEGGLKKANGKWKAINHLTDSTIKSCKNYEELESIEYFKEKLFPLVKAIDIGMVQDELEEWEQGIDKYISDMEESCERYAYSRRNAWRKSVPDGKKYGLDPVRFDSEKEYLDAINEEKYGWREWYRERDYCGLDPDAFETQEEFIRVFNIKEVEERARAREERLRRRKEPEAAAVDPALLNDRTVYTYCGVVLPFSTRPYSFRTDDATIKPGDIVKVPVGEAETETEGIVVSVGQYSRIAVPYPVEKTKFILGKYDEEIE